MRKFSHAPGSRLLSSALSAVIVSALCFSVGEGLRLTPFPTATLSQTEELNHSVRNASDRTSLLQYGPLDVPAQNQKPGKRQVLSLIGPVASGTCYAVPELSSYIEHDSTSLGLIVFAARPAGRAPPFLL